MSKILNEAGLFPATDANLMEAENRAMNNSSDS